MTANEFVRECVVEKGNRCIYVRPIPEAGPFCPTCWSQTEELTPVRLDTRQCERGHTLPDQPPLAVGGFA
jgi:hypothetical protein